MTKNEKDIFIQIQNSIISLKVLVLVNCLNTFVHDCNFRLLVVSSFGKERGGKLVYKTINVVKHI